MSKPNITLTYNEHRNREVVSLCFDKDFELISRVKTIPGATWSQSRKFWYIPREGFNLGKVFDVLSPVAYLDYSALKQQGGVLLKKEKPKAKIEKEPVKIPKGYTNVLLQKRYAENTKKIYLSYFADFMRHFNNRNLEEITKQEINEYILELIKTQNISPSQQNQRINAIKFYYEKVLGRQSEYYDIERPRKGFLLPTVISEGEIFRMLKTTNNLKNKLIISLLYSSGIRRNELINLRKQDIMKYKELIFVRGGKGNKDRVTLLSESLVVLLEKYYEGCKPNYWVLENPDSRKQYSATSVLNIVKKAGRKAGIPITVTPHVLRHCFGTHLLEQGVDIRVIQMLMGHESTKTTERYTHVSNKTLAKINSPLDHFLNRNNNTNSNLKNEQ